MCATFIVRCICGHEFRRNVVKCAQAIRSQLELADADIVEGSATTRSGCICEIHFPEEYLKPDICEECTKKGLIGDYLTNDPRVKFDIVKEWLAQKRALKAQQIDMDMGVKRTMELEDHDSMIEEPVFEENSSASSVTSDHLSTPISGTQPSDICTLEIDHGIDEAELEALSLLSWCFAKPEFIQSEPQVDNKSDSTSKQTQFFGNAYNLQGRAATLKERLDCLIAENKERRALGAKDRS